MPTPPIEIYIGDLVQMRKQHPCGGDTWRVVYTVRFEKAIYVLHCFQKKSPSGVRTALHDVELIRERLKSARNDYEVRYGQKRN